MQEGPRVKNVQLQFSFWAHTVDRFIKATVKLAYGPVHHGYMKNHI